MSDEQFEAHIKGAAWYGVLSEAAKDDDDGASIFRMARMAAREAWQASRRSALEEAGAFMDKRADELAACGNHTADTMARIYHAEAAAIRALANGGE